MTSNDNAKEQAIAQYNSIAAMVASLSVDYDRLEELQDSYNAFKDGDAEMKLSDEEIEELAQLESDAGECKDEDSAREAIQNDALDVQVREDWKNPGEESTPSEFMILLCTGGPAVRIMGDLDDYMTPCRAYIEYQDWGTPWTMLDSTYVDSATLLTYCQQFYFGE